MLPSIVSTSIPLNRDREVQTVLLRTHCESTEQSTDFASVQLDYFGIHQIILKN